MNTDNKFSAVEAAAIAGCVKESNNTINAGNYTGSLIVKIDYAVKKGEAGEAKPTANILSKATLAKALVMAGIQAENFLPLLAKVAAEAILGNKKVEDALTEEDNRVLDMIARLDNELSEKLPKQPKSGRTAVTATVTRLEMDSTVAALLAA